MLDFSLVEIHLVKPVDFRFDLPRYDPALADALSPHRRRGKHRDAEKAQHGHQRAAVGNLYAPAGFRTATWRGTCFG